MTKPEWGLCKDCKWWQIEPNASIANGTMGLCIDEDLIRFRLRVSGNSGCNRFKHAPVQELVGAVNGV